MCRLTIHSWTDEAQGEEKWQATILYGFLQTISKQPKRKKKREKSEKERIFSASFPPPPSVLLSSELDQLMTWSVGENKKSNGQL